MGGDSCREGRATERGEAVKDGLRRTWLAKFGPLPADDFAQQVGFKGEEMAEEFVWRLDLDVPGLCGSIREVAQIARDQYGCAADDSGGEDMPILWMIGHLVDEGFDPADGRIGEEGS